MESFPGEERLLLEMKKKIQRHFTFDGKESGCRKYLPTLAQLVERLTVEYVVIKGSLVQIREVGFFCLISDYDCFCSKGIKKIKRFMKKITR